MIAAGVRRCPRPKDDETVHPADARVCVQHGPALEISV